jgi:hypothetical protein
MTISFDNLDGEYEVITQTSDGGGPFTVKGDGITVIKNGQTYRKDKNGCIWESAFSVLGPDKVELQSTIDPSHADAFILDEKGNPTKSLVTFKSVLDGKIVDGKIILTGTIKHGKEITHLTMKQR